MNDVMTGTTPTGTFDDPRYARLAVDSADAYQTAQPFPHIVLDDFLPEGLARELSAAFPVDTDEGWIVRDNADNRRRYQHDETKVPLRLREMLREFNSRQFVLFLETVTGIDNLFPDPYFIGGGVHVSEQGDFLNVHADFNWHHKLQAFRRVNALLFLPDEWHEEWAGANELWSLDMSKPEVVTYPFFNRLLIFSTSEGSNHGQPVPNACPPGVYRKVLNLYYYTSAREDEAGVEPHFTLYKSADQPSDRDPKAAGWNTEASPFAMSLGEDFRRSAEQSASSD